MKGKKFLWLHILLTNVHWRCFSHLLLLVLLIFMTHKNTTHEDKLLKKLTCYTPIKSEKPNCRVLIKCLYLTIDFMFINKVTVSTWNFIINEMNSASKWNLCFFLNLRLFISHNSDQTPNGRLCAVILKCMNWNSVIKYVLCKFSPRACSVSPADMACEMKKYSEGIISAQSQIFTRVCQAKSGPQNLAEKSPKPACL